MAALLYAAGIAGAVAQTAPVFSPVAGSYNVQQTVTLTSSAGTTIYYTLDGTTPTTSSSHVATGGTVVVPNSATLEAVAYSGGTASTVTSGLYNITGEVSAGAYHVVALRSNGTVEVWGDNSSNQINSSTTLLNSAKPVAVALSTTATAVAAGGYHTLALLSDGTVESFGLNGNGQLGSGSTSGVGPVAVTGLSGVKAVAAGGYHSLALMSDGTVKAWGMNSFGELGNNSTTDSSSPVTVSGLSDIVAISAGIYSSYALKSDGTVYAWGYNGYYQLGDGSGVDQHTPVALSSVSNVTAISAGWYHCAVVESNGTVWSWGYAYDGEMGDGNFYFGAQPTPTEAYGITDAVSVSCGSTHTVVIRQNGSMWAWGNNSTGALGNGEVWITSLIPVPQASLLTANVVGISAGGYDTLALRADGTISGFGMNQYGELADGQGQGRPLPVQVFASQGVTQAAAGEFYSSFAKSDGTAGWLGDIETGNLYLGGQDPNDQAFEIQGVSGMTSPVTQVASGDNHTLLLCADGTVWAYGVGYDGELGDGNYDANMTPTQISGLSHIVWVSAGGASSLAVDSSGNVYTWGYDGYGQLGDGTTNDNPTPTQVSGITGVARAAMGVDHVVAIKSDGTAYVWGANDQEQLLPVSTATITSPTQVSGVTQAVSAAASLAYSLVLNKDGSVMSWGESANGETGQGTTATSSTPTTITGLSNVTAVSAGIYHALALFQNGTVAAWGDNELGDVGNNSYAEQDSPVLVSGLTNVVSISAGYLHSLAVKADGSAWSWGNNGNEQLGVSNRRENRAVTRLITDANDTDADGIPDSWELQNFTSLSHDGTGDGDSDGLTDIQEFMLGTNPHKARTAAGQFTDIANPLYYQNRNYSCTLSTISGDAQHSLVSAFAYQPLVVQVKDSSGNIIPGALVYAKVVSGGGLLAKWKASSTLTAGIPLNADANGEVHVYYQQGATSGVTSSIEFLAGNATATLTAVTDADSDGNGLGDAWETEYFGATGQNPNALGVNGLTLLQDYQQGINPTNYYSGSTPAIAIINGNNQTGALNTFLPQSLVIRAANSAGVALTNAPITFAVATGGGGISLSSSGSTGSSVSTTTDSSGQAQVYFKFPASASGADTITATAGTASVTFTESLPASGTPTVSLAVTTAAGATAPATLSMTATVSPSPAKVDFYEGQQLLSTVTASPYVLNLNNVGAGLHTYTAIATSSSGATGQGTATYTVNLSSDPIANYRYTRGTGTDQIYLSSLIAVGFEQGLQLDNTGNNSGKFPPGTTPWFMNLTDEEGIAYHIESNSGTISYPLQYSNPLVAFGQSTGGTTLYTKQSYQFGIAAGGQNQTSGTGLAQLVIEIYSKDIEITDGEGRFSPIAEIIVALPAVGTSQWDAFAANGYVADLHVNPDGTVSNADGALANLYQYSNPFGQAIDFDTKIQFVTGTLSTDVWGETSATLWPLLITHTSGNSDYEYKVNYFGTTLDSSGNSYAMATADPDGNQIDEDANWAYNLDYTLDFTDRPAWQSTYLSQPHFAGQPLPPTYEGQSTDELLHDSTPVTYQFPTPSGSTLTTLDNSPELREDPILDKFVSDMGSNPIALTNYILNNIHLCDAISYDDNSGVTQQTETSINQGGVNRSALDTFQESEGNPAEQCALEVYFLRKCGIPCGYVFPPHNSLTMLDARMSALLRMQLHGALTPGGDNSTVPQLLSVNYPWVAAYINGSWVHIFPWLKDTSISEGDNLADCLPDGYQTGLQWLQHYVNLDTSLLPSGTTWASLRASKQDNPGYLYPAWVNAQLAGQGMDTSDVGVTIFDRQNNFNSWSAMPQPWSVDTTGFASSNLIENLSALPVPSGSSIPGIFDTIEVIAYSDVNVNGKWDSGETKLDSGVMRALDLENRRFMVREVQTGNNAHSMQMSLEPLRPGTTATDAFTANGDNINKQYLATTLGVHDDNLNLRMIYNRHRSLPSSFFQTNTGTNLNPLGPGSSPVSPDPWSNFMNVNDTEQVVQERPFRKGDVITLCLDYGRVTQAMLNAQAQKYWSAQQTDLATGATMDPDMAVGTPLYLLGMSYYKQVSDFRATVEALDKENVVGFFAMGLSKMSPQRTSTGVLPTVPSGQPLAGDAGQINLLYPNVDMLFQRMAFVFNGTLHPDDGIPDATASNDWLYTLIGECSAQEHTVINQFFNLSDTASTVNLLHDAQTAGTPIVTLNDSNYTIAGAVSYDDPAYPGDSSHAKTLQAWAGSSMWASITQVLDASTAGPNADFAQVYITPGPVVCANKSYEGMGALVLDPSVQAEALISSNQLSVPLNGGYGASFDDGFNYGDDIYEGGSDGTDLTFNDPIVPTESTISFDDNGTPSMSIGAPTEDDPSVYEGSTPTYQDPTVVSQVNAGTTDLDPSTVLSVDQSITDLGLTPPPVDTDPGFFETLADDIAAIFNDGTPGETSFYGQMDSSAAEPVNPVTGAFYVNSPDMTIPGPMPIKITRNYDSLNQAQSEFGYGWKLGYFPYLAIGSNSLIYAAEMDGSVLAYRQVGSTGVWTPQPADNPNLVNQSGNTTGSVFNLFNNKLTVTGSGTSAVYTLTGADGSVRTFTVDSFPLPYASGTPAAQQITRQRPYLQKWTDAQGNYLTFTYGEDDATDKANFGIVNGVAQPDYGYLSRIASSNGDFVQFDYDTNGHIISINAADGRRLSYAYDSYGDLTTVTLPDASTINYTYSHLANDQAGSTGYYSTHLIINQTLPEGRVLTNSYMTDGSRRVAQQDSSVGTGNALVPTATFTYNNDGAGNGYTTIADANNNQTRYDYANSQITKITDQLGQTITQTWYSTTGSGTYQSSLATRTDKRGKTESFVYDSFGNLTETDTTGNLTGTGTTTSHQYVAYNSLNLPTQFTQTDGNYITYTYGTGSQAYLPVAVKTYAANGTLMSETDNTYTTVGTVGTVPFATGILSQVSKGIPGTSDESTVSYTYGTDGYPTSQTEATGTSDPARTFTLTYNLRGQLVTKTDSAGRSTNYAYDDLGHPIYEERRDQSSNLVGWKDTYYNSNGDVEWTQGDKYNPSDYTTTIYDGGGRLYQHLVYRSQAIADGSGIEAADIATTTYMHDKFGNLTQIMDPRGNTTVMTYDALGQMTGRSHVDVYGTTLSTESFTYEPGGKIATMTNPLGGVTSFYYTDNGELKEQDNPDGTVLKWTYLVDGRMATATYANGSQRNYSYDDAHHTVTQTLVDGSGKTLAIQLATTDSRGNTIKKVDADGFVTTSTYDGLNRVKSMTGPPANNNSAQEQMTYTYDAAGITKSVTDALGNTTITTYDALFRPVLMQVNNSSGQTVRSAGASYSPDHQSVTSFDGTKTNATITYTDLQGKPILVKHADGTFIVSAYDDAENLVSTTDEQGRTTTFAYDGLNRMAQEKLSDGATTTYTFDHAGDVLSRAMPNGLTWSATYDNDSRKLNEHDSQAGTTARSFTYTYYGDGPNIGRLATITDARGIVKTINYDSEGRKNQIAAFDPSGAQDGVTLSYNYDRRNLVTEIDQTYQNSTVSPPTTIKRTFDGYGAIATEQVYLNGALKDTWQSAHDADGRRSTLTELNNASLPFTYAYQADGALTETSFNGSNYQYEYSLDGLLDERTTPLHSQVINTRDSEGRITMETESAGGSTVLTESSIGWRGDFTQSAYTATRSGTGAWNETRGYTYDDSTGTNTGRAHLVGESFAPSSGTTASLAYQFDGNTAGGLGQLTSVNLTGAITGSRTETYGTVARLTSLSTTGSETGPLSTPVSQTFDADGNVATRAPADATDTMTWDALGRLVAVTRRDGSNNGFNWTAVYDGLGRRLQTSQQTVTSGTASGTPLVIQSSYDPDVRFMELAVTINGNREWLVHGPDLTGKYGGLQGTGGLEAVYNVASGTTTGVISNLNGHAEATVVGTTVTWNSVHSSGWGPEPGNTPQALDASHDVASSIAWRGHYVDATGYYYLGERYYAPDSGTFLSPDPLGHAASMDLYSAFDGDPINTFDPTGRCATDTSSSSGLGGLISQIGQAVVSLIQGALSAQEAPFIAAFGDSWGRAIANVVLTVEVDAVVALVAPEAEPFLIAEEVGGGAALEGGAALLEEGGAAAVADGEGLAATTEEAVEEVGVTEDALNGADVVETTVEDGAATAEATVNAAEDGAEAEVAVGKGIQSAEAGASEASAEATTAAAEETQAGGIEADEEPIVNNSTRLTDKEFDPLPMGQDVLDDVVANDPALQNVELTVAPRFTADLGENIAGTATEYTAIDMDSEISALAFRNRSELVGTIVHEEIHLRIGQMIRAGSKFYKNLRSSGAEEEYVKAIEARFLRMQQAAGR